MTDTIDDTKLKKTMLRKQACFALLTDKEIEMLANLLIEKQVAAGEEIVTEGAPVDSVYLIVSGKADVRKFTYKDNVAAFKSIATLTVNEAIGLNETGFYSLSGIRTATVVALTEMTLLQLKVAEFHGFALEYSHVNEVMRKNAQMFLATQDKK